MQRCNVRLSREAGARHPKSNFWASDPNGINQVGCVCTAQGFEFDYVGVIFGTHLVYADGWKGVRSASEDGVIRKAREAEFISLAKQTYRVLLTRGMKGCYVYCEDAGDKGVLQRVLWSLY